MQNSAIEWTDHTFNPWTGCTKVSPGCANCYAESWAKRSGTVQWGPGKPRRRTKTWGDPVKWNRAAGQSLNSWNLHVELCRQMSPSSSTAPSSHPQALDVHETDFVNIAKVPQLGIPCGVSAFS